MNTESRRDTFRLTEHITAEAWGYETRYSWGHKARLFRDGQEIAHAKITYYNRTWEAYQFESILEDIVNKKGALPTEDRAACLAAIRNKKFVEVQS